MSEVKKEFDPKEVEREMLEAAQNRAVDPAESAAMVYTMYRPEVMKRLPKLSQKAMRRVLQRLIEHPLNETELKASTNLEQEFFMLADSMLQSKFILMQQTYMESAEQLVNAQDSLIFEKNVNEEV